jgi:S-adenosylmethionine:tRNA ribosyltransferase-isomerase
VIDSNGHISHAARARFVDFLNRGDLVIANDAATLPASLGGIHVPSGEAIEVRLAGHHALAINGGKVFSSIVFGAGDFRIRTEDRPLPPLLAPGDRLALGPLSAIVTGLLGHPRLVMLRFDGSADEIWAGLAAHGRPIQYAHVPEPLRLWDVWTPIAGPPVAFEPPSAGFALDWHSLAMMRERGIEFATITHAAGISSTGDANLDRRLPLDEAYRIPRSTAAAILRVKAISRVKERCGRVVAVGTTVVRALEHAASIDGRVRAGESIATQRIDATSKLRVVDAILSGTHEPGSSHYAMLSAFADGDVLQRATQELNECGYRTHEFGDSVMVVKSTAQPSECRGIPAPESNARPSPGMP